MRERKGFGRWSIRLVCLAGIVLCLVAYQVFAAKPEEEHIFSTWEGFEPDKCASIWLIQKFIDQQAKIQFFPRGEIISEGIPFDVPDARFRRYADKSTYESLLHHYHLTDDPKLVHIGKIIHDLEINIWERKVMPETITVRDSIIRIITETKDEKQVIDQGNHFFDILYRELKSNVPKHDH